MTNDAYLLVRMDRAALGLVRKNLHDYCKDRGIPATAIPFVHGRPNYRSLETLMEVTLDDARKVAAARFATGFQCFQCQRWCVTHSQKPTAIFKMLKRHGWREIAGMALCGKCSQGGKLGVPITMFSQHRPRIARKILQ